MKRRYPGPRSFSYDDRDLFYGRKQEIEYIFTLILNHRITVLHGKSGYGKTSLLNAGIIPKLLDSFNCEIIRVRLYNYEKEKLLNPRDTLIETLKIQQTSDKLFLHELIPGAPVSAWRYFKKLQAEALEKVKVEEEEAYVSSLNYVLLFDQFEELFTYPKEYVHQFGKELCDLLQNRIPLEYQVALKEAFNKDKVSANHSGEEPKLIREELNILEKDVPVKIIFSIRSDRFNHLTYLTDFVPGLLINTYKLKRMTELQVEEAIILPALEENNFDSPRFQYDPPLLALIMDFLSSNNEEEKKVEVFEMQIICSALENFLMKHYTKDQPGQPFLITESLIAENEQTNNSKKIFIEIIEKYYIQAITDIKDEDERLASRYLIEEKLIDSITGGRISLDHAFIQRMGISTETITYLIDKRIIRIELNSFSGRSYELSHGSLVAPILDAREELGNLNKQLADFFNKSLHSFNKDKRKEVTEALFALLPNQKEEDGYSPFLNETMLSEILHASPLITKVKLLATEGKKVKKILVKEIFLPSVQQLKVKLQQHNITSLLKRFKIWILVAFLAIIALTIIAFFTNREKNRNYGLVYVAYDIDTINNKIDVLQLVKHIYDKSWNTDYEKSKLESKFLEVLKTPEVQSSLSVYTDTLTTSNLKYEDVDISQSGDYVLVHGYNDLDSSFYEGKFRITEIHKKIIKAFNGIGYSYFTNGHDTVALAKVSTTLKWFDPQFKRREDTLILYDCKTARSFDTLNLGNKRYLYPIDYKENHQNDDFDSYRARFTSSGNLIVPFFQKDANNNFVGKVGLWFPGKDSLIYNSDMSISISKDRKKFMSGMYLNEKMPYVTIYNEDGHSLDTIQNILFADFTPKGSVVYARTDGYLVIRSYNSNNLNKGVDRFIKNDSAINYVYVNTQETVALLEGRNVIHTKSLVNNATTIWASADQFVDINLEKNVVVTYSKKYDESKKIFLDTIYKKSMLNNETTGYPCPEGIKSVKYNRNKDELLLLTNKNKLFLIDSDMKKKASFQLTPNDLFGFSKDGTRIFYVMDKLISVFDNDNNLFDIFHFRDGYDWLTHNKKIQPLSNRKMKDIYHLNLK